MGAGPGPVDRRQGKGKLLMDGLTRAVPVPVRSCPDPDPDTISVPVTAWTADEDDSTVPCPDCFGLGSNARACCYRCVGYGLLPAPYGDF